MHAACPVLSSFLLSGFLISYSYLISLEFLMHAACGVLGCFLFPVDGSLLCLPNSFPLYNLTLHYTPFELCMEYANPVLNPVLHAEASSFVFQCWG